MNRASNKIKKKSTKDSFDILGTPYAQKMVWDTLTLLPTDVAHFAADNYVFICHDKALDGSHWVFNDPLFRGKMGIIILSEHLWENKNKLEVASIIAHEVAHAWKRHPNPQTNSRNPKQVKMIWKKSRQREKVADKLALRWLSKYFDKRILVKLSRT